MIRIYSHVSIPCPFGEEVWVTIISLAGAIGIHEDSVVFVGTVLIVISNKNIDIGDIMPGVSMETVFLDNHDSTIMIIVKRVNYNNPIVSLDQLNRVNDPFKIHLTSKYPISLTFSKANGMFWLNMSGECQGLNLLNLSVPNSYTPRDPINQKHKGCRRGFVTEYIRNLKQFLLQTLRGPQLNDLMEVLSRFRCSTNHEMRLIWTQERVRAALAKLEELEREGYGCGHSITEGNPFVLENMEEFRTKGTEETEETEETANQPVFVPSLGTGPKIELFGEAEIHRSEDIISDDDAFALFMACLTLHIALTLLTFLKDPDDNKVNPQFIFLLLISILS